MTQGSTTLNYTYDNNGNVTNDGVHTYQYDAENRQVSVDSGSTASYSYDSMNRRIKKVVGAAITHYTWVGHQALAEYNGSTGVSTRLNYFAGSKMITTFAGGQQQLILSDRLSARRDRVKCCGNKFRASLTPSVSRLHRQLRRQLHRA